MKTIAPSHGFLSRNWMIVGAASAGLLLGFSTFVGVVFGLFIIPLSQEFGWSRTEISFALSICTFIIIILAPFLGIVMDKYGVRKLLLPSLVSLGIVICSMALLTSSLWHFYLMYVLVPLVGIATIPTSYTRVILNWFDEKRGLALGLALSGVGFGAVIMPPFIQFIISNYGWRNAYLGFGLLVLFVNFPIAYFFLKETPEKPAGQMIETPAASLEKSKKSSKGGAIWNRYFIVLITTFFMLGIATLGVSIHLFSSLTDQGLSAGQAAISMSILGVFLILARIICGLLCDKYFAPYVACLFLIGMAIGILILGVMDTYGTLSLIALALLGLGFGAEFDLMSYLVSRYFGLHSYGQVYGYMYAAFSIGAACGPVIMGQIYDNFDSYQFGFIAFSFIGFIAAFLMLALGPYPIFQDKTYRKPIS